MILPVRNFPLKTHHPVYLYNVDQTTAGWLLSDSDTCSAALQVQGPLRRGGMDVAHEVRQIPRRGRNSPRLSPDFFCSEVNDESRVSAGYWVLSPWLFSFPFDKGFLHLKWLSVFYIFDENDKNVK